jgi:hypothetical protein
MPITEVLRYTGQLWWSWPLSLLILAVACGAAWTKRFRSGSVVGPVLAVSVMLVHVGRGLAASWAGIDGGGGASISAGLWEATSVGPLFGWPVLLASLWIAVPTALRRQDELDERPDVQVTGGFVLGAASVVVSTVLLAWFTGLTVQLGLAVLGLGALVWAIQTAAPDQPSFAVLLPMALLGAWFAVSGSVTADWLGSLATGMPTDGGQSVDPWLGRLLAFGLSLGFAGIVGRRWATLAVPVVFGALLVGSAHNMMVVITTPFEEGGPQPDLPGRW